MSNYGIKVSKPGFDVKTANSADLYVDSSVPLLKIFDQGAGSQVYNGTASGIETTITHNLGYTPLVRVYMETDPGDNRQVVTSTYNSFGTLTPTLSYPSANAIKITGTVIGGTPTAGTYGYYYYIFLDPIV